MNARGRVSTVGRTRNPSRSTGKGARSTKRHRPGEQIEEGEKWSGLLVEHLPEALMVHAGGDIIYINPAGVRLLSGTGPDEFAGRRVRDFLSPRSVQAATSGFGANGKGDEPTCVETELVRLDGRVINVEVLEAPVTYGGKPAKQVVIRDLTERKRAEEALRQSEKTYRALVEKASGVPYVTDREGALVFVGHQVQDYGCAAEELIGENIAQLIYPEDLESTLQAFQNAVEHGIEAVTTFRVQTPRMGVRYLEDSGRVIRDDHGCIVGVTGILRDVTEQRRAELALAESERRYRLLADNVSDLIFTMDTDLKFTYVSPAVMRLRGYSVQEALGQKLEDALTPGSVESLTQAFLSDLAAEQVEQEDLFSPRTLEVELERKDGSTVWAEVNMTPLRDAGGGPAGILGVVRDVSERKRAEEELQKAKEELEHRVRDRTAALLKTNEQLQLEIGERKRIEEALRENERRYRLLAENVTDVIWTMDLDQRLTYVGPSVTRQRGYSVEEALSQTMEEILTPACLELAVGVISEELDIEAMEQTEPQRSRTVELEMRCKDGSVIWTETTANILRDADGEAIGIMGVSRDITDRKRADEKLQQTMAELARSNAELEQFAYVASHDLQEPLRMVSSYVQLLARRYKGKFDADADDFISYAVDGASRMQSLINDLLSYSRVGRLGKPFALTDCEAVLYGTITNLNVAIQESGAVITHDPLPTIMADGSQIMQVFQNLIGNAIKFRGDEPPHIHVSAERREDSWVFSVRDNGIGIAPEFHQRVFLVFQRLHSRSEYPGTGAGLAICQKIVGRHGGSIWVESEPGKGAVFYFTIAVSREE